MVKEGASSDTLQWVEGSLYDTLFSVYKGGNTTVIVDSADTNGQIMKYYWDVLGDGVNDSTLVPRWTTFLLPNQPVLFKVWGKDDDGLLSNTLPFYVYPDAPPPAPQPFNPSAGIADTVILRWTNWDAKDGKDGTVFQVYAGYGGAAPTTMVVSQLGSAYGWDSANSRYLFKFLPTHPSFSWKIVAVDARGSTAECARQDYAP